MSLEDLCIDTRPNLVVGLGNEIAGDDGVGIRAARWLERLLAGREDVEVVALPWAGFALLDMLAGRRRVAIVDCLVSGRHAPGTIVRLDESDFRGSVRLVSFHDIDFATVLAFGRRMALPMPAEIAIWAVEGGTVDTFAEGLSAPVDAAVPRVADEVVAFLDVTLPYQTAPAGARTVLGAT
ncbi:MAG: hydrogenase maturation protease [bacterium]|nr:hydrogenase maturation protease [bacterium]